MRIREMKAILIYWLFIELIFLFICIKNGFNNVLIIITICSFPLLFLEIYELIMLLKHYNSDEKALKKYNVIIDNHVLLKDIKYFEIIKIMDDLGFYIIDDKRNLLFKVINKPWSNTYYIIDYNDKVIGVISKKFNLESTYIIRLIDKEPMAVKARLGVNYDYDVYNNNYKVAGNYSYNRGYNGLKNTIFKDDKTVAHIQFLSSKHFLYHLSNAEINIVENMDNIEEVIFIAMSVTLGNQSRFNTEISR